MSNLLPAIIRMLDAEALRDTWPWVYQEADSGKLHSSPPENISMYCRRIPPDEFRHLFPNICHETN